MSDELEAAGALATATGVAHAVGSGPHAPAGAVHGACGNCATPLTGAYCHACGQPGHLHRSLLHLAEEVLHGVLHFDTKAWRTLPLLVARPGLLTRRYIDGQRARHVAPLALFLFTMFLMFFVASLTGDGPTSVNWVSDINGMADDKRAELLEAIKEARGEVTDQQIELETAQRDRSPVDTAERGLAHARTALLAAEAALQAFDDAAPQRAALAAAGAASAAPAVAPPNTRTNTRTNTRVETGSAVLNAAIERVLKNPELAFYKLKNTAYKFSFLLVPLLLPFMWLMFLSRPGVAVYDHAVFALYSLSFMSLLFTSGALLAMTPLKDHLGWLMLAVPLHAFVHLRGTYGLSPWSAGWRTAALLVVAGIVCLVFLVFIVWVGWH